MQTQPCFLLAGGPSLEGFDYAQLDSYTTIGVNKIFKVYSPTILYCMDRSFFTYIYAPEQNKMPEDRRILEQWKNCTSRKMFIASNSKEKNTSRFFKDDPVEIIPRLNNHCISMDITKGIYPGNNSGFGALMLAIALGYKRIFLLGYDLKTRNSKTHFHEGYNKTRFETLQKHLVNFRKTFEKFSADVQKAGIEVINLSQESDLVCFRKMKFEDVQNILKKELEDDTRKT